PSGHPRVVSVYDVWFLAHPDRAAPAVGRAAQALRRSVRSGATVHASSHATAARARELLGTDRVEVIHLAPLVPEDISASPPPWAAEVAGRPLALAIGTLERRKNIPALVDAFGRAAGSVPDLTLLLAGADGDDAAAVTTAIE